MELVHDFSKFDKNCNLLAQRQSFFASVNALRLMNKVVQGDHLGQDHRNLHFTAHMDPPRHQNVVLHLVELNLRKFREKGLNLVGRDSVIIHHTTNELFFLLAKGAMVQRSELGLTELALSCVPWSHEHLTLGELGFLNCESSL